MNWHADGPTLSRYASGALDLVRASSVEAHLLACPACRAVLGKEADPRRMEAGWTAIQDAIDAPERGWVERFLGLAGVPDHLARLLAATRSLQASWLAAVAVVLGFAVLAAHGARVGGGLLTFLLLAPLLPVAGVGAAFAPALDPCYELALASPMHSFRLLLVRATAVLAATTALSAAAALALPAAGWEAVGWLLPGLALTAVSLAMSTTVRPEAAAAAVSGLWVAGVIFAEAGAAGGVRAALRSGEVQSFLFQPPGQAALAATALAAAALVVTRRAAFDMKGSS